MTTGAARLDPLQIEFADQVFDLLPMRGRAPRWERTAVPGQPGDNQPKPTPIELHAGYGASRRFRRGNGQQTDPAHHAYAENAMATLEGVVHPSPRITYLDMSGLVAERRGFRIGGYSNSRIGGSGANIGAIGGGVVADTPQYIREFGDALYVSGGVYTYTVNPNLATPAAVEAHYHGSSARARKSDVFGNKLIVATGEGAAAEMATEPYTSNAGTPWVSLPVSREVVTTGVGGRLFSSLGGKVWNVLGGNDPLVLANYEPSNGEQISDDSDPVRSLVEYLTALVAGTARTARTLDPNRGYQGVALVPESRLSASEYDGRAFLAIGTIAFHATTRAVNLFRPGVPPEAVGPEELQLNETPYAEVEYGTPDWLGDWMAWPAYVPATGDSVIFLARLRKPGEVGSGPVAWHDVLYLAGRECRCVRLWGGSETYGPRLFFGAAQAGNPAQIGWCDPRDVFHNDGQPAQSGFIEWPLDDMGAPGVRKSVERIEVPYVEGVDATNYAVISVRTEDGSLVNLVKDQSGASNPERIDEEGFTAVYVPTATPILGRQLGGRIAFTQSSGATEFIKLRGTMLLYYSEVPREVWGIETVIDAQTDDLRAAEEQADALRALYALGHRRLRHTPDGKDRYARLSVLKVGLVETHGGDGEKTDQRLGITVAFREVPTA